METTAPPTETSGVAPQSVARFLPILLILFFGSGCSALIYEVTWYQVLQLALGSTAVSLGILLATFTGTMGQFGLTCGTVIWIRKRNEKLGINLADLNR